eukprot:scaffold12308_cov74-Cyclotella_meneghiniana.AAC.16
MEYGKGVAINLGDCWCRYILSNDLDRGWGHQLLMVLPIICILVCDTAIRPYTIKRGHHDCDEDVDVDDSEDPEDLDWKWVDVDFLDEQITMTKTC